METIKKNDFVEIKYTGFSNGEMFDSNIESDLKKINEKAKPIKTIVVIGQGMVVPGLDKALEGKEIGKEYEASMSASEGFGERKRELVKMIPLKVFREQKIDPYPGLMLSMDQTIAKIITVSGGRVMTDFNNPLAGKPISYKFTITRKVTDEKEKCEVILGLLFRFVPEFEIKGSDVIIKGHKQLEAFVKVFGEKFKELMGKDLKFEESKEEKKKEDSREKKNSEDKKEHK